MTIKPDEMTVGVLYKIKLCGPYLGPQYDHEYVGMYLSTEKCFKHSIFLCGSETKYLRNICWDAIVLT